MKNIQAVLVLSLDKFNIQKERQMIKKYIKKPVVSEVVKKKICLILFFSLILKTYPEYLDVFLFLCIFIFMTNKIEDDEEDIWLFFSLLLIQCMLIFLIYCAIPLIPAILK